MRSGFVAREGDFKVLWDEFITIVDGFNVQWDQSLSIHRIFNKYKQVWMINVQDGYVVDATDQPTHLARTTNVLAPQLH
jgi:hypothetical protein